MCKVCTWLELSSVHWILQLHWFGCFVVALMHWFWCSNDADACKHLIKVNLLFASVHNYLRYLLQMRYLPEVMRYLRVPTWGHEVPSCSDLKSWGTSAIVGWSNTCKMQWKCIVCIVFAMCGLICNIVIVFAIFSLVFALKLHTIMLKILELMHNVKFFAIKVNSSVKNWKRGVFIVKCICRDAKGLPMQKNQSLNVLCNCLSTDQLYNAP